jgi:selenocysteine-specific elongation factor
MTAAPLTLGTAGHVDHGKTTLVQALTGVDTDRLPEEKARGLTIALGYAPLELPDGRRLSIVDVPGHERFVRTMVAGATGVDMYLMTVAADDGVMSQTVEHAAVLQALRVRDGVVAVTKADLGDAARAAREAADLLPGVAIVPCSARTGEGLAELVEAIAKLAARVPSRAAEPGEPLLHIDRVFSVRGRGTVVTGTLWSGALSRGDLLRVHPGGPRVRVRALQVHGEQAEPAHAGQRVAVNLAGARTGALAVGDVLAPAGALAESRVLDCALQLRGAAHAQRVQVHHGTRAVTGRLAHLGDDLWQLRLERGLLARDGDRVVVRRLAPPDTLGGGRVLDCRAARHGRREEVLTRLRALRDGVASPARDRGGREPGAAAHARTAAPLARPSSASSELHAVERRLREAGAAMLSEAALGEQRQALAELRARGTAVRVSGRLYAHAAVAQEMRAAMLDLLARSSSITVAQARDALGISRKSAQAFLEHLDAMRITRRLSDDRRVLSRAGAAASAHTGPLARRTR